ncbi:dynamin family protein [Nostoc sp. DedSLP04]|uniref:dynamin family protein n=1 Tax=Nostoc sp. DedSLP04 TaxID=3075401 RepID=UPI002AD5A654|nr:dynamin family protein [Nostoc sp. DedSLP04]MDZ8034954.1 dynamin family protein [Nostoc sp. DedSLP04]
MDFLTQALLAVVYAIARSALDKVGERIGERVGDTIYEKFLGLLEQRSPNTAIAIRKTPLEALDYGQLFQEVEAETQTNSEFAQTARQLALTAKEHPLPNLNKVLQNFAVVEELKPQILELQSLISVWKKKMVNIDEIKQFLPDATDEQAQRYTTQLKRLGELESFFSEYPQELNGYKDFLNRAKKAFNYRQPYRIAVIGTTGAGKSTMLNAMLGRELVLTKSVGKAATGAALEIFLDVSENQDEKAVVTYRDEDNIHQLIDEHFVQQYQLDESKLNGELNESFSKALSELQMQSSTNEQVRKDFEKLREILVELTEQYANNNSNNLRTHFSLNNSTDFKELMELIDENSDLNRQGSSKRMIGLVKSVTYHIKSDRNSNGVQTLQLPNNVCLVDLPGLDGSPLHDIIISEGIKDADAVIFIIRPPRILGRGDDYLLDRVGKYISLKGKVESGERIFLVLNAKDLIMTDMAPTTLKQDMEELMNKLFEYETSPLLNKRGGDAPYFMTSALAAYCAQKKIKGEQIGDHNTYEAIKVKLRVKDNSDEEVLKASQVPKLVEELTKFARDKRIEGQIRDGKQALDSIINPLYSKYDSEYRRVIDNQGQYASQKNIETQLEDQRKALEKKLLNFRKKILSTFEERRQLLQNKAKNICDEADDNLRKEMPRIWKEHFKTGNDKLAIDEIGRVLLEPVLSDAQVELWDDLNERVPRLAISLTDFYREAFQKYQVVQKIVSHCFGSKEIVEIETKIQKFIDDMDRTMTQIAERIAMTQMTNPATHFTAFQNDKPEKEQLFKSLSSPDMLNEDLSADKFVNFITEARKLYENFISDYCVSGLLNLYRYEMLLVEDYLLQYIEDVFTEMRIQIPFLMNSDTPAPVWLSKMRASDPNWEYEVSLKSKISTLSSIKE